MPTVTFSAVTSEADVFVEKAAFSLWETEVTIGTPAGRISLSSTLIGRHNLPNILAAVATGLALTIDGEGIPLRVSSRCFSRWARKFLEIACPAPPAMRRR